MKKRLFLIIICYLFLIASANSIRAEWEDYIPSNLKTLLDNYKDYDSDHNPVVEVPDSTVKVYIPSQFVKAKVVTTFTGKVRKIDKDKLFAMGSCLGENVKLFEEEMLFADKSTEYWLPVQQQLIPYLKNELNRGDQVELLIMWMGLVQKTSPNKVHDLIFAVNEFRKLQPAKAKKR